MGRFEMPMVECLLSFCLKLKTKTYIIQPLTPEKRAAHKEHRGKRLHFGGAGRKFRLIIETEAGTTAPWRIIGGIQLVVETDPD